MSHLHPASRRPGYTFVELIVASTIFLIIIAAAVALEAAYKRSFFLGTGYAAAHTDARLATDWIIKDAKSAAELVKTYGGYTTQDDCVILKLPTVNSSLNFVDFTYDYVIYALSGANIQRVVVANAASRRASETRTVATNCTTLSFTSVSGSGLSTYTAAGLGGLNAINATVTISKPVASLTGVATTAQETMYGMAKLRNKQ